MKFSICIPNYNYERYLGRTIQSALDQSYGELEILVSDNASTDGSVAVVRKLNDPRVQLHVNACNVGFAGNLDRASRMAIGAYMILLSSDDLMRPVALAAYKKLFDHLGSKGRSSIVTASVDVINAEDRVTGHLGPDMKLWTPADRKTELETLLGVPVYGVPAGELLRRCLRQMKTPFHFAATCYSRELYQAVEGYGGGRLINPDKWFHWKALGAAEMAYFIDQPLFGYRWHGNNQGSLESAAGALKYMVDEYVSTLELDTKVLEKIGLTREDVARAFIEYDVGRHGLATLARGLRKKARRLLHFGRAVYPQYVRRNRYVWALRALLALGPIGQRIAARAYRSYRDPSDDPTPQ
jgi:glycosyltransferase involved in cell wall biosynthesis